MRSMKQENNNQTTGVQMRNKTKLIVEISYNLQNRINELDKQMELIRAKATELWLKDFISGSTKYNLLDDNVTSSDFRKQIEEEKEKESK